MRSLGPSQLRRESTDAERTEEGMVAALRRKSGEGGGASAL
jgi:hypothetical protein